MNSFEEIIGSSFISEKDTVIKIIIRGTGDGIINGLDYKVFSNNNKINEFLNTIKTNVVGLSATDILEEITADNILENLELEEDDIYIASVIEKVIQKAVINYIQLQLKVPSELNYEE